MTAALAQRGTRTCLFREEPGAVPTTVDGVVAVRGAVAEVDLDALLVHATEQLVLPVLRHGQLIQGHNLNSQTNNTARTSAKQRTPSRYGKARCGALQVR